jgi:xanthine/CO dehydrogenase XdhC/CoxF family maturation factor
MVPVVAEDDAVLDQLAAWLDQGRQVAIATVVQTWGSSPRPAGSQLVVEAGGAFLGSVSAGCVEAAVIAAAQESIADRQTRILDFGVSDQRAWEVGLACGGAIRIYVEPVE